MSLTYLDVMISHVLVMIMSNQIMTLKLGAQSTQICVSLISVCHVCIVIFEFVAMN